jgi:hypothetical protein
MLMLSGFCGRGIPSTRGDRASGAGAAGGILFWGSELPLPAGGKLWALRFGAGWAFFKQRLPPHGEGVCNSAATPL